MVLAAMGFSSREFCKSELCKQLAVADGYRVPVAEWPFWAIEKTNLARSVDKERIEEMLEVDNFQRVLLSEDQLDGRKVSITQFTKLVRIYRMFYLGVGSDNVKILIKESNEGTTVESARLVRESIASM